MRARLGALALSLMLSMGLASACTGPSGQVVQSRTGTEYRIPEPYYQWTIYYARAYGLEPALLMAVIWTESTYCQEAVSKSGAIGLGQLMPGTAAGMGVNPRDPVHNIYGSARYLRQQYDSFGDWSLALAAYNAGPSRVREARGIPDIAETINYVNRVFYTYQRLRAVNGVK